MPCHRRPRLEAASARLCLLAPPHRIALAAAVPLGFDLESTMTSRVRIGSAALGLAALLISAAACAGTGDYLELGVLESGRVAPLLRAADSAREEVAEGRAFRKLDEDGRQRVLSAHAELVASLDGVVRIEQLDPGARKRVLDAQLAYREALSSVQEHREICRREKPGGSNIAVTVCRTRAEWDRSAIEARLGR
jgi:hypothetical protein